MRGRRRRRRRRRSDIRMASAIACRPGPLDLAASWCRTPSRRDPRAPRPSADQASEIFRGGGGGGPRHGHRLAWWSPGRPARDAGSPPRRAPRSRPRLGGQTSPLSFLRRDYRATPIEPPSSVSRSANCLRAAAHARRPLVIQRPRHRHQLPKPLARMASALDWTGKGRA